MIAIVSMFLQELKFVFPNAQRMNRGGQVGEWPFSPPTLLCDAAVIALF